MKKPTTVEEKIDKKEVFELIKKEYPPQKGVSIDIRPLWGNCYRLNFWNKNEPEGIIKSNFISISKGSKGLEIKNYDDPVKNN